MRQENYLRRIAWLFILFTVGLFVISLRLLYLQVIMRAEFHSEAALQRTHTVNVSALRGAIYDAKGLPLAVSVKSTGVYAWSSEIEDKEAFAELLAHYIDLDAGTIVERLKRHNGAVWLQYYLTPQQKTALQELGLPGLYFSETYQRSYPNGTMAAHILGIVGVDNQGLEGLEWYYDRELRGSAGMVQVEKDTGSRVIPDGLMRYVAPRNGFDLVLTIDAILQHIAEKELRQAVLDSQSRAGTIIISEPSTGKILAAAVYPEFDPNYFNQTSQAARRNPVFTAQYEPGSTFKVFTMAIALEEGLVALDSPFIDPGYARIGGITVRCHKSGGHGSITAADALVQSCNPVFALLGSEYIGGTLMYRYLSAFGFGSKSGIDFPGEITGTLPRAGTIAGEAARWATIGFGQGVAVTPIQLINAVNVIANGGTLYRPYLVSELRHPDGKESKTFTPQVIRQVISEETAASVANLMMEVVDRGTGHNGAVAGYAIAGKTGTAEVAVSGGYGQERIASFVGFGPVEDPRISVLVILDEPQTSSKYGSVLAAPVFQRVMSQALKYLQVNTRKSELASLEIPLYSLDREKRDLKEITGVPNVIGRSMRDGAIILSEAGFRVEIRGTGVIYQQEPIEGTVIPTGEVVTIYCSVVE
ncbi:MAG: penicillin-binding transpeptidase domain-containing protein [Limnochordia bacterium]|nr:penicillin-binding transpeptidase domain-containing protein [Limnochordia bacterium]MDD2629631.1 penicillin-binding transpeptidase domain-containing protein [Limnochordia bacterium]